MTDKKSTEMDAVSAKWQGRDIMADKVAEFLSLLHAARIMKALGQGQRARRDYLTLPELCPVCSAHKINYLLSMRRPCYQEHGIGCRKGENGK